MNVFYEAHLQSSHNLVKALCTTTNHKHFDEGSKRRTENYISQLLHWQGVKALLSCGAGGWGLARIQGDTKLETR